MHIRNNAKVDNKIRLCRLTVYFRYTLIDLVNRVQIKFDIIMHIVHFDSKQSMTDSIDRLKIIVGLKRRVTYAWIYFPNYFLLKVSSYFLFLRLFPATSSIYLALTGCQQDSLCKTFIQNRKRYK